MAVGRVRDMYTHSQVISHFLSEMNENPEAGIQAHIRQLKTKTLGVQLSHVCEGSWYIGIVTEFAARPSRV